MTGVLLSSITWSAINHSAVTGDYALSVVLLGMMFFIVGQFFVDRWRPEYGEKDFHPGKLWKMPRTTTRGGLWRQAAFSTAVGAVDADGEAVRTAYKLSGSAIVQTIQHSGAAYPVVADPSFSYGLGIYVRWSLDGNDDPEDVIDNVGDWNDTIADWNCWLFEGSIAVVSLGMAKKLAEITAAQAATLIGLNLFGDGIFCSGVNGDRDDVNDALDDIEDAMPDAIDPWNGEIAEDCTLMARHYYGGFMINKLQLEDCYTATGIY